MKNAITSPAPTSWNGLRQRRNRRKSAGQRRRLLLEPLEPRYLLRQYLVDTLVDEEDTEFGTGDFSLREALTIANGDFEPARIKFDSELFGQTITLTLGELTISHEVTVEGPGAELLTINGNANGAIFHIDTGATAELSGLRLTNASASAVTNVAAVTVRDALIDYNTNDNGGAILSAVGSSVTVINSRLQNNTATGGSAIGRGGAISSRGTLTIVDSLIANNTAGTAGGIHHFTTSSPLLIQSSTLSGNIASAGDGGALIADGNGSNIIRNSTITGNQAAADAGGIYFGHGAQLINSTVSENTAVTNGGGIVIGRGAATAAPLELRNNTIVLNQATNGTGGGIYHFDNGAHLLHNNIVAENTSGSTGTIHDDIRNAALSQVDGASSNNVIGVNTGLLGISNGTNGNQIGNSGSPLIPLLDTLRFNGGLTQTYGLLSGSPAINQGNPTEALNENGSPLIGDQRGPAFPRAVGVVDVGAFEHGSVFDMGDAPDPYQNTLAENGPLHVLGSGLAFGAGVDADADGQPSAAADGDDTDGNDDEDGVTLSATPVAGHVASVEFVLTAPGIVNAWADFNGDGVFQDSEQIVTDVSGGTSTSVVNFPVPQSSIANVIARFRVSSQAGLGPNGSTGDGEVEDYAWTVRLRDYGDAPAPYPTRLSDNGPVHWAGTPYLGTDGAHGGASQDEESDGQPSLLADADDLDGMDDDEDGVLFNTPIHVGQLGATVTVVLPTSGGSAGKLNAWIDFNNDGSWGGPGEQVADDLSVSSGNNLVTFDVPSWAASGSLVSRWRINSVGGLLPTGLAFDGEVEDHLVPVQPPVMSTVYFSDQQLVTTPNAVVLAVATADIDGDGDMDVLSGAEQGFGLVLHINDGAENFNRTTVANGFNATKVHPVDLDRDGDLDILVVDFSNGTLLWYRNDGGLSFVSNTVTSTLTDHADVFATDLDMDGDTDLVSASFGNDAIVWFENDGNQNFTQRSLGTADGPQSVHAADVDRDGDLDVLSASANDDTIAWYVNDGLQAFTKRVISNTADSARSVFATDINGDGFLDVLAASINDSKIAWHENDRTPSDGGWVEHVVSGTAVGANKVVAGDLDGDGDTDIGAALYANGLPSDAVVWYDNDGQQAFTKRVLDVADGGRDLALGDLDGDGDLDVVGGIRNEGVSGLRWYENLPKLQVDTLVDEDDGDWSSGDFSLREAIGVANSSLGPDVLTFAAGISGTIELGGTELRIEDDLTITGPGAEVVTVSGDNVSRVFNIRDGATVTIADLTVADGNQTLQPGGGIQLVGATLTLLRTHIRDNQSNQQGGGIATSGTSTLVIRDSTISDNVSDQGGGLYNAGGIVKIINSTISANDGAGAGGVYHFSSSPLEITNSTITGNTGLGGLNAPDQKATLNNTIVAGNFGFQSAPRDIIGNLVATSAHNLIGDAATAGGLVHGTQGNLVGNAGSGTVAINTVLDSTLQNNGGPTPTHALVPGGPAQDAGDIALAIDENLAALTFDQRGESFARQVGAAVDIGAFEATTAPDQLGLSSQSRYFYLDGNGNGSWNRVVGGDLFFDFGLGALQNVGTPIVGDWDGDGVDDLGLFNDSYFYLDTSGNGRWDGVSGGDTFYDFKVGGDRSDPVPVIGDWDGDGDSEIGLYNRGYFYLDTNSQAGSVAGRWDRVAGGDTFYDFSLNALRDVGRPIIGDWDGDGTDNLGLFNDSYFYLDTTGNGRWDRVSGGDTFYDFRAGDRTLPEPVIGDWDGDGSDNIGLYLDTYFYLDANSQPGSVVGQWDRVAGGDSFHEFRPGGPRDGFVPLIGKWQSPPPPAASGSQAAPTAAAGEDGKPSASTTAEGELASPYSASRRTSPNTVTDAGPVARPAAAGVLDATSLPLAANGFGAASNVRAGKVDFRLPPLRSAFTGRQPDRIRRPHAAVPSPRAVDHQAVTGSRSATIPPLSEEHGSRRPRFGWTWGEDLESVLGNIAEDVARALRPEP